jgi:hypothetical protein
MHDSENVKNLLHQHNQEVLQKDKNILPHNYGCNNEYSMTGSWFKAVIIDAWARRSNSYAAMFDLTFKTQILCNRKSMAEEGRLH